MEQKRVFKMGVMERNMLVQGAYPLFMEAKENGGDYKFIGNFMLRIGKSTDKKVFLTDEEYKLARDALNHLRNEFLAADRYTDAIDDVLYRLIKTKVKRC